MVVQTAPAVRVAIGEEMGLAPGAVSTGQLVAGLKALGFDYVFDTGGGNWVGGACGWRRVVTPGSLAGGCTVRGAA
jgi:hypothetical protein